MLKVHKERKYGSEYATPLEPLSGIAAKRQSDTFDYSSEDTSYFYSALKNNKSPSEYHCLNNDVTNFAKNYDRIKQILANTLKLRTLTEDMMIGKTNDCSIRRGSKAMTSALQTPAGKKSFTTQKLYIKNSVSIEKSPPLPDVKIDKRGHIDLDESTSVNTGQTLKDMGTRPIRAVKTKGRRTLLPIIGVRSKTT